MATTTLTIREWIERDPLAAPHRDLLLKAVATRGKNKDGIKEACPSSFKDPVAHGVWASFMSVLAPVRAPLFSLMYTPEAQAAYKEVDKYVSSHRSVWNALERPMRFNLWALDFDVDKVRSILIGELNKRVDQHANN